MRFGFALLEQEQSSMLVGKGWLGGSDDAAWGAAMGVGGLKLITGFAPSCHWRWSPPCFRWHHASPKHMQCSCGPTRR